MALSQITPSLFLSGSEGAQNAALVSQKGITLIVNATLTQTSPPFPGVEFVRVPVSDLPSARIDRHFDLVAERIHGNRGGKTLVHCAAGMSRSPALVMAYLMRFGGATLRQAHAQVRDKRPHIRLNRGFWEQLLTYERRLYGKNTVRLANEQEVGCGNGPMTAQNTAQSSPLTTQLTTKNTLTTPLSRLTTPLTSQHATLMSQHATLTSQHTTLTSQHATLTSQHATLTSQHTTLTSQHATLTSALTKPAPLTPRLKRAEPAAHRKCLSLVPKSPLMRRQSNAGHSGRVAASRVYVKK